MNDYIKNALRTKSPEFYGDRIALLEFQHVAREAVKHLRELDAIKKTLFYGREYRMQSQTFSPNVSQLSAKIVNQTGMKNGADIIHCIIGKATEAGELLELLLDVSLEHKEFDVINFIEELGDGQWYDAIGASAVYSSFDQIQKTNIAKLKARFPDKFTEEKAENRDLAGERKVLETSPGLEK